MRLVFFAFRKSGTRCILIVSFLPLCFDYVQRFVSAVVNSTPTLTQALASLADVDYDPACKHCDCGDQEFV